MEISTHLHPAISYRVGYILKIVNCKFLWYYVNDLITGWDISFVLVSQQLINFTLLDFVICCFPYNVASCLETFNMMTSDTYIYFADLQVWIGCITILKCGLNSFDGLINIQNHSVLNAVAICSAKAKDLKFSEFILSSGYCSDLGSANIKTYNNGLFLVHSCSF